MRVQPGAARSEIAGWEPDGALRLRLQAPPVEGRANRALIEFLADALGVKRSAIRLVHGATARRKLIEIDGLTEAEVRTRLGGAGAPPG